MKRKNVWLALQAVVTLVLLAWLVRGLDVVAFLALFARLPGWFYLLSLAVVFGGQVLYAWRWRLLLTAAGVRTSFAVVLRQYFIGIFLNNFFPSTVGGDLAKVYLLGRDHGYRIVAASIVLDRVLGVGLLAVCASITLWLLPVPSSVVGAARLWVTGIAGASLILLGIAAAGTGGLPAQVAWMGRHVVSLAERLQRLRFDMAAVLTRPAVILQAAAIVIAYFVALAGVYVIFITVQTGNAPPFATTMSIVMTIAVLSNIPVALNGLGLREQLHAALLAPLGVPREAAIGISLLFFGHLLLASLLGMMFWMRTPAIPYDAAARLEV